MLANDMLMAAVSSRSSTSCKTLHTPGGLVDTDTLAAFGITFEVFEFVLPTWTYLSSAKLVEEDRASALQEA
jgi:hypothetical protein